MSTGTVWIGGGTGAGKTTVTRMLAGRRGLRVFPLDAFWYSHLARLPEPEPDPDEQWLGQSPQAQAAEFEALTRRRWPLVLSDLAALPSSPPIVVEGPQVLPDLVPEGDQAVFLVATAAFQRSVLQQRPLPETADPARALVQRIEKDRLYAQQIIQLAHAHGHSVITVDGTRSPGSILEEVERIFKVHHGSSVSSGELSAARRWENRVVADNIRTWLTTPHAPPQLPDTYRFACECGVRPCVAVVELPLDVFEGEPRILAPGHLV
ncbi:hypothetical protein Rhe02_56170 [Rhizocola hellebori]|uniref:Uncharacterized protein n=1 Tax=Rhizocola hellebori TaxID=1392758 RepID=A0A8J3QDC2_9ACTN|nr:hypothetical protein [Rhizocola hellebori]GIH07550.1 hypothetical protein Rhe02_56170 [Rhizocola hellebori]